MLLVSGAEAQGKVGGRLPHGFAYGCANTGLDFTWLIYDAYYNILGDTSECSEINSMVKSFKREADTRGTINSTV